MNIELENIVKNKEFESVIDLLENSKENVFITGKAGTGKSTLIQYFKKTTKKRIAVVSPTGVSALNVGGQTIHSFFMLPPKLILKESIHKIKKKESLIKKLDALVIDEVSMVRADLMDAIDRSLRVNRDIMDMPFGGVQVVFVGDLFQLSPVVNRNESEGIFEEMYKTPYFFSSGIFRDGDFIKKLKFVELATNYRHMDSAFISLLNKTRDKTLKEKDYESLNERVSDVINDEVLTLTTTNYAANVINEKKMSGLEAKEYSYEARVEDKFEKEIYPADYILKLKAGAQVMLLKNDTYKRWVNGTICRIHSLSEDVIEVDIDGRLRKIEKGTWLKIKYKFSKKTNRIEEEIIGTFEQYPVKLAWAVTIHKSQGLTFDKVNINFGTGTFAPGQAYVALSRSRSLEGITLTRPITRRDIIFDNRICEFINIFRSTEKLSVP